MPTITSVVGEWDLVVSQNATKPGTMAHTITSTVTGTRAKIETTTFKQELSSSSQWEFQLHKYIKATGKYEWKVGFEQSRQIQEVLSRGHSVSVTNLCNTSPGQNEMYQWNFHVDEACFIEKGECKSVVRTLHSLCVTNRPPNAEPVCPPNHCADTYCSVCN
jgi:hypothetical protein